MWNPREIGRLGGKARTERQRAAARLNGAKGGRPPKRPGQDSPRAVWHKFRLYHIVKLATELARVGANSRRFSHAFWPLSEDVVRKELIRRGRRDLWENLQIQLQLSSTLFHAQLMAEIRATQKNPS